MTTPKTADQLDARIITYQLEWSLRRKVWLHGTLNDWPWTALEGECWDRPEHAQERLKYYQKCSLATVLDFRVSEREEVLK